ncbi:MAG: 50S ribosomal protein L15 [Candidatus Kerfeldbacteria bacterium]|nr:50S ribosomal protein L15 [Candidatus Kerfeldbacteria bacterium]
MINLYSLQAATPRRRPKRVGRGNASGKGTTAGRGTKGQRARTGGRKKLTRRGMKHLIERTPKWRGFRSLRRRFEAVSLAVLEQQFPEGAVVTPHTMQQAGLVGRPPQRVKIIGAGPAQKKMTIHAHRFSRRAAEAIARAGGKVVELLPRTQPSSVTNA